MDDEFAASWPNLFEAQYSTLNRFRHAPMAGRGRRDDLSGLLRRYYDVRTNNHDGAELEVRIKSVDLVAFKAILAELAKPDLDLPVEVSQTLNMISDRRHKREYGMLVESLLYVNGQMDDAGRKTYKKTSRHTPVQRKDGRIPLYTIHLNEEEDINYKPAHDDNKLLRFKLRFSFMDYADVPGFRVDLTISKEIRSVAASTMGDDGTTTIATTTALKIREEMFPRGVEITPQNVFTHLKLLKEGGDPSVYAERYRYEVELEHVGADVPQPDEVDIAARNILAIADAKGISSARKQREIWRVAQHVLEPEAAGAYEYRKGLKDLSVPVRSIGRADYKSMYPPVGSFVTDKADGKHCIASAYDGACHLIADDLTIIPGGADLVDENTRRVGDRFIHQTIVEGELIGGGDSGEPASLWIFDVLWFAGENLTDEPFETRVRRIPDAVELLSNYRFSVHGKTFTEITSEVPEVLEVQFRGVEEPDVPYERDGIILVSPGKPWRQTMSYKWKSLWDTTIDFLVHPAPKSVLGEAPYMEKEGHTLFFLFVGINPGLFSSLRLGYCPGYNEIFRSRKKRGGSPYFPIQFQPSGSPLAYLYWHPNEAGPDADTPWVPPGELAGNIAEFRCVGMCADQVGPPNWQMSRLRKDRLDALRGGRYFGNDFRIAELTWINYVDKFPREMLWNGPGSSYFAAAKSQIYYAPTAFTSFVKSKRIDEYAHTSTLVDLASGHGQDLGRYFSASIETLFAVDQDKSALAELIRRKYSHRKRIGQGRGQGRGGRRERTVSTALHVLAADLSQNWETTFEELRSLGLPEEGVDVVVMNLALHYFCGDSESFDNLAMLIDAVLKPGGRLSFTVMIGERVHRALQDGAGEFLVEEDGALKYSIQRRYREGESLTLWGQKIGVLLPFSDGEHYEESLVNTEAVIDHLGQYGIYHTKTIPFDEHFNRFRVNNKKQHDRLTEGDRAYVSLYGEVLFRKSKQATVALPYEIAAIRVQEAREELRGMWTRAEKKQSLFVQKAFARLIFNVIKHSYETPALEMLRQGTNLGGLFDTVPESRRIFVAEVDAVSGDMGPAILAAAERVLSNPIFPEELPEWSGSASSLGSMRVGTSHTKFTKKVRDSLQAQWVSTGLRSDFLKDFKTLTYAYHILGMFDDVSFTYFLRTEEDRLGPVMERGAVGELFASPFDHRSPYYLAPFPEDKWFGAHGQYPKDRESLTDIVDILYGNPPFDEYILNEAAQWLLDSGKPFEYITPAWDDADYAVTLTGAGVEKEDVESYEHVAKGKTISVKTYHWSFHG